MSLYLFADNNEGTAENLGSYRLYNMKIEGDSEGVESGVNYVDCLIGDNDSWIDTGIVAKPNYRIEATFTSTVDKYAYSTPEDKSHSAIWGASTGTGYGYDREPYGVSLNLKSSDVHIKNGGVISNPVSISVSCLNKKYTHSVIVSENVTNANNLYLFAINFGGATYSHADNTVKIYDFKIYNAEGTLIQHLRPCLDTEGVPCMYDEVSKQYFYNQGTGTFGYKKKLRDFQPVLDSNGVPCLMDKINKKYYYDKNGNLFGCAEQGEYKRVNYIQGDGVNYLNLGTWTFDANTKIKVKAKHINKQHATIFALERPYTAGYRFTYHGGADSFSFNTPSGDSITHKPNESNEYELTCSTTDTNTLYLFKTTEANGSLSNPSKIYYLKIYQSNELVFDGIPVLDNEGTPCMYDLVTETFFYNQGTGEFSYGIEEDEYSENHTPIKYIETNGTQYIDTGVVPTDNTDIDMVARACESKTIALDYFYETPSTHYYTPKFLCSELNDTIINNSEHELIVDYYSTDGTWKWQDTLASGSTTDLSSHSYISIRFVGTATTNYVNGYTFVLGNSLASHPRVSGVTISLQDCMSIGYLMNDFSIESTYKYKEIDTTVEPNLTASAGATLTLGSTYIPYLTESEIEQAVDNGWTIQ